VHVTKKSVGWLQKFMTNVRVNFTVQPTEWHIIETKSHQTDENKLLVAGKTSRTDTRKR